MSSNTATDNNNWRLDQNGKMIKSACEFNYFRTEFYELPRPRPTTVNVIFRELRRAVRGDIHALLDDVKFGTHNVRLIERSGIKSFHVDLITKEVKQEFITTVMQSYSKVITVYPLVQDLTKVTVGGLSWEISDREILSYLNKFGDFSCMPKDITYCKDSRGYWSAERVFTANDIAIEIPSFTTIFGKLITIRYKDQPPTCRLCDSRDHKGFECPLNPNFKRRDDASAASTGDPAANRKEAGLNASSAPDASSTNNEDHADQNNDAVIQDGVPAVTLINDTSLPNSDSVTSVAQISVSAAGISNSASSPQLTNASLTSDSTPPVITHVSSPSFASVVQSSGSASVSTTSVSHPVQMSTSSVSPASSNKQAHAKPAILKFLSSNPSPAIKILKPSGHNTKLSLNNKSKSSSSRVNAPWSRYVGPKKIPYQGRKIVQGDTVPDQVPHPVVDMDYYENESFPLLYPQSGSLKSPLDRGEPPFGVKKIPETMKERTKRKSVLSGQQSNDANASHSDVVSKVGEVKSLLSDDQINPSDTDPEKMEFALNELQSLLDKEDVKKDNESSTSGEAVSNQIEDSHELLNKAAPDKRETLRDLITYDMSLLNNCHANAAVPSTSGVASPAFQTLINNQIDKMKFSDEPDSDDDAAPPPKREKQESPPGIDELPVLKNSSVDNADEPSVSSKSGLKSEYLDEWAKVD